MKKWMINAALVALVAAPLSAPHFAWAQEDEITKEEIASEKIKNRPECRGAHFPEAESDLRAIEFARESAGALSSKNGRGP